MSPPIPSPEMIIAAANKFMDSPRFASNHGRIMDLANRLANRVSMIMDLANKVAVDATVSPTTTSAANCSIHSEAFEDCLNSQEFDDMAKCHYYVDMLADCCNKSTC